MISDARRIPNARLIMRIAAALLFGAAVLLVWKWGFLGLSDLAQLRAAIERARGVKYLPLMFVLSYAMLSSVGVPISPLTLAGGVLFGVGQGVLLNWLGACGGAALTFGAVRRLSLRSTKAPKLGGPAALFTLRMVPVAPFFLLNIGAAISSMTWAQFVAATSIGILPLTVVYTLFSANLVAGVAGEGRRALLTAVGAAAVMGALAVVAHVTRRRVTGNP